MPLQLTSTRFAQSIEPARALREDPECSLTVTETSLRIQAASKSRVAALDYSLPLPSEQTPLPDACDQFWVKIPLLWSFLRLDFTGSLNLRLPTETTDSRLHIQSPSMLYKLAPLDDGHKLPTVSSPATGSQATMRHEALARAVTIADIAGDTLQIRVDPDTNHIMFATSNSTTRDAFEYDPSVEFDRVHAAATDTVIDLQLLPDLVSKIPDTTPLSVTLTPSQLHLEWEYPTADATLTLIHDTLDHLPR